MNQKPLPPDEDVRQLAKRLKTLWTPKQGVRRFLRKHAVLLRELKDDEWSWAGLALALNKARITYRTGTPWTDTALMQAFSRAQVELKGHPHRAPSARQRESISAPPAFEERARVTPKTSAPAFAARTAAVRAAIPVRQFAELDFILDEPCGNAEPEFQPARFIDWDERRRIAREAATAAPASSAQNEAPTHQLSEHYLKTMERLTGKKPTF